MNREADLPRRFAHDLDGDARRLGNAVGSVGGIGKRALDEGKAPARRLEQRHRPVAVLDRGWVDLQDKEAAIRIDQGVTLASPHLLPCVISARAARLGGFRALAVDHGGRRAELAKVPSAKPMEGQRRVASRPERSRSSTTKWWFIASHTPASRNAANQAYTVCLGGKHFGSMRHGTPPRST
jgi:hypothetical protein